MCAVIFGLLVNSYNCEGVWPIRPMHATGETHFSRFIFQNDDLPLIYLVCRYAGRFVATKMISARLLCMPCRFDNKLATYVFHEKIRNHLCTVL